MKKSYIILSIFLVLGIIVIVISVYIARQSLKEITVDEKKLQIQTTTAKQPTISPRPLEQRKEPLKTKTEEAEPQEPEFADLSQIPDDYIEEIERKGESAEGPKEEETVLSEEQKSSKYPTIKKLKELKSKGAIIY